MLFTILASVLFTLLIGLLSFTNTEKLYKFLWIVPASFFVSLLLKREEMLSANNMLVEHYSWIPNLGVDFNLGLSPFSWFFSLLITGIGTLIFYYASAYMKGHSRQGTFFAYLAFFMTSMIGLVLSDNLILMFLFWELTSISSFFLIGFDHEEERVRQSAMLSLAITGLGGFFLLLAFVLIGYSAGTYNLSELSVATLASDLQTNGTLIWVLISLFLGAFTKSAQFPFHFWLPNAMKAPTPVSAYLHSATMVKAGVFVLAIFAPFFQGIALWHNVLMGIGLLTMLYAAFQALFQKDLKGILAYSTVASLAIMVFLIGLGTPNAYVALMFFVLAHAVYKAALFITAGSIDVVTGTRDILQLRGLKHISIAFAVAAFVVTLSNSGWPLTLGFMAKDFIYLSVTDVVWMQWVLVAALLLVNIILAYAGYMVGWRPFGGEKSEVVQAVSEEKKSSSFLLPLWLPIMILAVVSVVLGLFPQWVYDHVLSAGVGQLNYQFLDLNNHLFPGFNIILLLSVLTLVLGLLLYFAKKGKPYASKLMAEDSKANPFDLMLNFHQQSKSAAFKYSRFLHSGYLRRYLMTIIVFFIALTSYVLFSSTSIQFSTAEFSAIGIYEIIIFVMTVASMFMVVVTPSRLTAIASMGIIGLSMSLFFVFYGAPDLAMTQFTIDTLTVVLFVLVLYRLPQFRKYVGANTMIAQGLVSLIFGGLIALIALQAYYQPVVKEVSEYFAANAFLEGKGKNVVNVILVDFRGFDTMVEIIVLGISAIGVYSMLKIDIDKVNNS